MRITAAVRRFRMGDWVVALVVLAVFLIPSLLLALGHKPTRFGFQMYSGYGKVEASWRDPQGVNHAITLNDFVASVRGDIDWPGTLPEELCRRIPEAVSVAVRHERSGGAVLRRVQC